MAATEIAVLSKVEAKDFEKQKEIVTKGMRTFVEVGHALRVIRDEKYYRADHATFEAFCFFEWNIKRDRAYQLIDASEAAQNVENFLQKSPILPTVESHAKPLTALESPEAQAAAWEQVVASAPIDAAGNPKITAAHVQSVVDEIIEADAEPEPKSAPKPKVDIAGLAAIYKQAISDLNRIKREFKELAGEKQTGSYLSLVITRIERAIDDAKTPIAQSMPVTICHKCKGDKCAKCQQTGFWTKAVLDGATK